MSHELEDDLIKRFQAISEVPKASRNMCMFLENAPEPIAERFLDLLEAINRTPHLEYKVKALIRMILSMTQGHERGVVAWSQAAMKAGASQQDVIEAMYTVIPQIGAIPIIRMLPLVLGDHRDVSYDDLVNIDPVN